MNDNEKIIAAAVGLVIVAGVLFLFLGTGVTTQPTVPETTEPTQPTVTEPSEPTIVSPVTPKIERKDVVNEISNFRIPYDRDDEGYIRETNPTITFTARDDDGIQSCGVSAKDPYEWDCVVRSPGAKQTDVDCTLNNYGFPGKYSLYVSCTNVNGKQGSYKLLSDIYLKAP